jgi:hypothetical protein
MINVVNLKAYTAPLIIEEKNKEWVSFGEDNNYFQRLIDLYEGSPTNGACINGISQMVFGRGLDAVNANLQPEAYAQMKSLFKDNDVRKVVHDLKLLGQCAMQVIYNSDHTKIVEVSHFPVETLRAEKCNEDGEIEAYYYCADWSDARPNDSHEKIPAFGMSNEEIEILYIKPYTSGYYYYSPPSYASGIAYCELEMEIGNYHISNVKNGLAPGAMISFNNGVPDEEERRIIENTIQQKWGSSSNAGKFILQFNDSKENEGTFTPIQLSDAHNQYQFLSSESSEKILIAHRIVSPMLLGIKDKTGLGSNKDELITASILLDNTTIRPFQDLLIDSFDQVLAFNNISLRLFFKSLQPLEFVSYTQEEREEEEVNPAQEVGLSKNCPDGYEMMGDNCVPIDMVQQMMTQALNDLTEVGEDEDLEQWELIDERPAGDNEGRIHGALNLASVISSSPSETSEQDTSIIKVRYQYAPLSASSNSREFCNKMVSAAKIYRYEDLDKETSANSEFAPSGSSAYNVFFFKGGVNCQHFWMRKTYLRKNNKSISVNEARRLINEIDPSLRDEARLPENPKEVAQIAESGNNYWSLDPNYRK